MRYLLTDDEKEFYEKVFQIEKGGFRKGFMAGFIVAMLIAILIAIVL